MGKILVVDDDELIAMALSIQLRNAGHQVLVLHSGLRAVAAASKEDFNLIIMDIGMAAGDGLSSTMNLRRQPRSAQVPVILITAGRHPDLRTRAMEVGAAAFFEKPYDEAALLSRAADLIALDSRP